MFYTEYADIQGTKLVCTESVLAFPCLRPANVGQGEMVQVDELTAQAWELDGRSGMSFRARGMASMRSSSKQAA